MRTDARAARSSKRYGIRQESVQRAAMEKVKSYVRGLTETAIERRGAA